MLKIWGRISSINVRKVVWAAQEAGLDFVRIDAGRQFGVVDTASYEAINPMRQVPTIEDNGFVLWESNAIVRYLCAQYNRALYPQELQARFDAERWMDWQQTELNPAGKNAFVQWIRTPAPTRDVQAIAASVRNTEPLMALLNQHLQDREYLTGGHFSMADIPIGCEVHRWFNLPQAKPQWPHLERWYVQVSQRPGAQGVLNLELS